MGVMLQGHSQSIVPNNKKQNKPKIKSKANKKKFLCFQKACFPGVWCGVVFLNKDLLSHQCVLLYNYGGNQICAMTMGSCITVHLFHSKCDFKRGENLSLM